MYFRNIKFNFKVLCIFIISICLFLFNFRFMTLFSDNFISLVRSFKPFILDLTQGYYAKLKKIFVFVMCFVIQMENENKITLMIQPVNWLVVTKKSTKGDE